ncbi:hypothetical protein BDP27DRAFT_1263569 [Rhodocollybia butyracea]|uniref:Mitochondrial intermembrane space import and assembly protein 40 n=1 Tax=Rhodocollybia butyracea TaxID=206335 RepID=A0A9P5U967_9AGAR|nr:hypothetical protein BDP27DRAFT_1263569 [Rhodocollybia butyracea]
MFSQLRKAPLRRCLHTQTPRAVPKTLSYRLGFTLAASTVVSYTAWRWTRDQRIALDSATSTDSHNTPVLDSPSSETHHTFSTPKTTSEGSTDTDAPPKPDAEKPQSGEAEEGSDSASQGAYNPETGEINWDCPCLGGMAHGPCGPEFREAFSCFIYSEEEPKGINCVEKFQGMQTCFRAHPEVYADEIVDDEDEGQAPEAAADSEKTGDTASSTQAETASPAASTPAQPTSQPPAEKSYSSPSTAGSENTAEKSSS